MEIHEMDTQERSSIDALSQRRDAFVERLLQATRGTFEIFSIYLGVRLGFYDTVASAGPLTPAELASRTGTHERYVREWLEQQAVTGILEVGNEQGEGTGRPVSLTDG